MMPAMEPDLRERLQLALGSQYRLERELGRGGMGIVFEAVDTTLDRRVAIKVVHPELTHNDGIVRRFLAEARMIAKLRHPGIVAVHAAGSADGLLYYVMDQVDGESLRERLDRQPRPPRMPRDDRSRDFRRVVGRIVVDDHELPLERRRQGQRRLASLGERRRPVAGADDDGCAGGGHGNSVRSLCFGSIRSSPRRQVGVESSKRPVLRPLALNLFGSRIANRR